MRIIIIAAILLAALIGLGMWTEKSISHTAEQIDQNLQAVNRSVAKSDWKKAGEELSTASQKWHEVKNEWSIIVDHKEIDNIDVGVKRLGSYIAAHNKSLSLGELSSLRLFITHIPDKESLSWEAVL